MTENAKEIQRALGDGNASEGSQEEIKVSEQRQDAFVVFSNEKDLRHHEAIRIKASIYTGIALRVKIISPGAMENLLYAIDLDSGVVKKKTAEEEGKETKPKGKKAIEEAKKKEEEEKKKQEEAANQLANPSAAKSGIVNLRFEECKFSRKAAALLSEWLKSKALIETMGLVKVSFEDVSDFKKITEGVKLNQKIQKLSFQSMNLEEEVHGTAIGRVLSDSRTIRELDMTHIVFDYRTFYDMCQAILNERCRLNVLKLRGLIVGEIEGKIIQFILMKNKQIHTLDLSECRTEDPANFEFFFEKLNQFCNIRYLTLEKMQPDLSHNIETIGEALAENNKLEVLVIRDNKIKWINYQNFFSNLLPNRHIQKLNLQKTDLTDRVMEKLAKYVEQDGIQLADLDLSKNQITDIGLKLLSQSLSCNKSILYLNLAQNKIKEEGFPELVETLKNNTSILEISLGGNIISNDGIAILSEMLPFNKTLRHLDLSRNAFNDSGFDTFAEALGSNEGLTFLDIAKNKEVTDEGALLVFCEALTRNKKLQTIDLTGLTVRKPFLKQNFDQALKRNITLQEVIGKIPSNIINAELEQNIMIEKEVLPLYQPTFHAGKDAFNLAQVESDPANHSRLNLKDQPPRLLKSAFKLIRNYDIRSVDFTSSGIHDDSMRMLSSYLRSDPNLRSIVLDNNMFTDDGMSKLVRELEGNTKLAHLSIRGCTNVTDNGLQKLCDVISTTNTCLFQVDLDIDHFDEELARTVVTESVLNRDIQEKLKPVRVITHLNMAGEVIRVIRGSEQREVDSDQSSEEDVKGVVASPTSNDAASRRMSLDEGNHQQTETTEASALGMIAIKDKGATDNEDKQAEQNTMMTEIIEVQFDKDSKVGDCFESALKAWRINQPNLIRVEKQNLHDEHIEKLCKFLEGREMVNTLNLRRNVIGNQGAKCLATFMTENDHTLTHLDVTRNRIGQDGGQAILAALEQTTRIVDCQIKYGNPISNKMGRIIEREIKANIQAVSYANKHGSQGAVQKYQLADKGPEFMRCAIKMAQIHNILHLSLPDNMLALEDSRMIADLIKRDTPLRKLDLQTNQLDADCAALIANSLIYNSKLQLLDVSGNLLGDLGAFLLLTPLIRQKLQHQGVVSKSTPTIREKVLAQGKDVRGSKRNFKNIEIKTQLQYVNIENNMTTTDIYKQVWLLLVTNPDIIVKVDDPQIEKDQDNLSLFGSTIVKSQSSGTNAIVPGSTPSKKVVPEGASTQLLDGTKGGSEWMGSANKDQSLESNPEDDDEEISEEALLELERQAIIKEKERKLAIKREKAFQRKKKSVICCQKFCCFKDPDQEYNLDDRMPTSTQVCCWRFLRARKSSTKFYTGKDTLHALEKSSYTGAVSLLISVNYIAMYANVIVPFVMIMIKDEVKSVVVEGEEIFCDEDPDVCAFEKELSQKSFNNFVLLCNMGVLAYSLICESIVICMSLKPTNTKCNSYIICQAINGLTMRAVILISAQLIAVFIQDIDIVNFTLGVVLCSTLVLSQIRAFQIWMVSIKKDKNCLLPKLNQNFRICLSTNYLALATLYKKVSVEASEKAIEQTKALVAERERLMSFSGFADEDNKKSKRDSSNVKEKLNKCKCCRLSSPKFYQLIMNDIPLVFCLPFAYIFGLMDTVNVGVAALMTLTDLICMLVYLSYDDDNRFDTGYVYQLAGSRIGDQQTVLTRLMSDQVEEPIIDIEGIDINSLDESDGHQLLSGDAEGEVLLTEQQREDGENNPNNQTQTIGFDSANGGVSMQPGEAARGGEQAAVKGDLEENVIVNENANAETLRAEGLKLPPIVTDFPADK